MVIVVAQDLKKFKNFNGKLYDKLRCLFYKNGKRHRYYGPAAIWKDKYKEWFFNNYTYGSTDDYYNYKSNSYYCQKQFLKDINKQWLL